MAISQQQIASHLNVSVATISRALKNDQAISPRMRALVLKTATQMGYDSQLATRPRYNAAEAASQHERLPICAIIQTDTLPGTTGNVNDYLVTGCLTGMSAAVCQLNSSLILHYVPLKNREHAAEPEQLPVAVRNGRIGGLILLNYYPQEVVRQFAAHYPCLSLSYDYGIPQVDVVETSAEHLIAQHLNKLYQAGHRRIAFVGPIYRHAWARRRYTAYIGAMLEKQLTKHHLVAMPQDDLEQSATGQLDRLTQDGITAFICANDHVGYQVMSHLQSTGKRVPQDISITGVDGIPVPHGTLKLQSARLAAEYMGATAIKALFERIDQPNLPTRHITLDGVMIEGETIANVKI